ncbi:MAG TPA: hypothetical protein VHZ56_00860 [Devosia sp.]|nr:hypothetical protein [Devosia sp.]
MTIYLPSTGPEGWQRLLADPYKHWRTGFSAKAVAHCWEAASGLPPEIDALLGGGTELLFATPEHKVPLPGGRRASQCDVFALVRRSDETISVAIEAKVDEPFGPVLSEWLSDDSEGKRQRLDAILTMLGASEPPLSLHYQLFHRTAAAIVEARRFKTDAAAMIVHSFSSTVRWFDAFAAFAEFLGISCSVGDAGTTILFDGRPLTIGWAKGDPKFLTI